MATWSDTVPCNEVHGSIDEDFTDDGITCSVELHCAAGQRHVLIRDLKKERRPWPYLPVAIAPVVSRIKSRLFPSGGTTDASGQGIVYDMAVLTVTFTTDIKNKLSEELVPSVQFQRQDHKGYYWRKPNDDDSVNEPDDAVTEEEAPGKQQHGLVLTRTHYDVDINSLPTNWKQFVGKVHNQAYNSVLLNETFAPGTLRFDAPKISRSVRTDEEVELSLTTRWAYNEQGWNKFYRGANDTYQPILKLVKGNKELDPEDPLYKDNYQVWENYPAANLTQVMNIA